MNFDLYKSPLGKDKDNKDVYLKDIWPSNQEIEEIMLTSLNSEMFKKGIRMSQRVLKSGGRLTLQIVIFIIGKKAQPIERPLFFDNLPDKPEGFKPINDARILLVLGDTVTTDHISPAGSIKRKVQQGLF